MPLSRLLVLSFFAGVLFALTGCEGPTGPEGPPGRPGQGAFVDSEVVVFDVSAAAVQDGFASVAYDAPLITRSVVDNGLVLAYFREAETWTAMPYTYGVDDPELAAVNYTVTFGYAYERGFLELFYEVSVPETDFVRGLIEDGALRDQEVKVVVVESLPASGAVDLSSYASVKAYYGLEE